MSRLWFYQLDGEELGPVPIKALRRLHARGELTLDHLVRPLDDDDDWSSLGSHAEQFELELAPAAAVASAPVAESIPLGAPKLDGGSIPSDWFCQIDGEILGPVTLGEIQGFCIQRLLGRQHQVREGDGKWRSVGEVASLAEFLPAISKPTHTSRGTARLASPEADTDSVLQAPGIPGRSSAAPAPSAAGWFCDIDGEIFGPLELADLTLFIHRDILRASHRIANSIDGPWLPLSAVPDLDAAFHSRQSQKQIERPALSSSSASASDLEWSVPREASAASDGNKAPSPPPRSINDSWYVRTKGRTAGPMPFSEVLFLWTQGRLELTDELRHGDQGRWAPLEGLCGLLGIPARPEVRERADAKAKRLSDANVPIVAETEAPTKPPIRMAPPPTEAASSLMAEVIAEVVSRPEAKRIRLPDAQKVTPPQGIPVPKVRSDQNIATLDDADGDDEFAMNLLDSIPDEELPRARYSSSAPSYPPTPRPSAPALAPLTPASLSPKPRTLPPVRSASNSPSFLSAIPELIDNLRSSLSGGDSSSSMNTIAAAVLITVVLAVGFLYSPWAPGSTMSCFKKLQQVYTVYQKVKDKDSTHTEWKAFIEMTTPVQKQLNATLDHKGTRKDPLRRAMLSVTKDVLPEITKDVRDRDPEAEARFRKALSSFAIQLGTKADL